MNKSDSITELAKALAAFQGEVKQPLKDKTNPFFSSKYVPLENVVEAISETSSEHGLSFLQYPVNQESRVGIITILMHSSGEFIETEPIFATPAKQDAQATGSVITYLKRYALSAVFGITSDQDDDGNSASQGDNKQQQKQQAPPPSSNPNLLTDAQLKAIKTKLGNLSKNTGKQQLDVYKGAQDNLGIHKSTRELTKSEASKVIEYLSNLE